MKTKTFSNNRVTRSHSARREMPATPHRVSTENVQPTSSNSSVSKREIGAISRQAQEIRDSWTQAERVERAQLGAQRRAELCLMLFGAN